MNEPKDQTEAATEPPLDCRVRATLSVCCGIVRAGWHKPSVMHTGACRDKHDGELGKTYYLSDSGLTMDACGVMRFNKELRGAID